MDLPPHDGERDRHLPAALAAPQQRREQLERPVLHVELPLAAGVARKAVERDALRSDRATIKVERNSEIERRRAQERDETIEGKEGIFRRTEDDVAGAACPTKLRLASQRQSA
ncbi:MAG TPA: hypothetical protein VGG01_05330 [Xanthobacteraceae bacterium]